MNITSVVLDDDSLAILQKLGQQEDRSRSAVIRRLLREAGRERRQLQPTCEPEEETPAIPAR